MTLKTLIKGGRIIDPSQGIDKISDLLIVDGLVKEINTSISKPRNAEIFNAEGLIVCPGFIDIHCHLREPGEEYKETIQTGTAAAAAGGFTTVCAMPNTQPAMDNQSVVEYVLKKAKETASIRVLPIGSVTIGRKGKQLSEMSELADLGVIGFSDDGDPVEDPNIMRQALSYSAGLKLPIINHCEVPSLADGASMNEGWVSNRLGLKGMPSSAEEVMVARDISLAELTGGHVHIAHASTRGTIDLIRSAKANGTKVTCEVTPHHLTLTENTVMGHGKNDFQPLGTDAYDTNAKVNPPLRSKSDVASMIESLNTGTIDFIATDHAPHSEVDKMTTFQDSSFGISVLETALGSLMTLVDQGQMNVNTLIKKLTNDPATFLGKDIGNLKTGTSGDITIIDPNETWTVDPRNFISKGKNTPLKGSLLKGKVKATFYQGTKVY